MRSTSSQAAGTAAADSAGGRPGLATPSSASSQGGPGLWVAQYSSPDSPLVASDGAPLLRPSSASLLLQPCDPGQTRRLLLGPRCVVGRSKGDITFPNDKCVSRQHAAFTVSPSSHLGVIDTKSSTGVSVGGRRVPPEVEVRLRPGTRVQFGLGHPSSSSSSAAAGSSGVTVLETRLRVCLSRVDRQERARIAEALTLALCPAPTASASASAQGGPASQQPQWFVEDVRRSDVLVCHALSATTKVLAALVHRVPIVTPAWAYDLRDRVAAMRTAAASAASASASALSVSAEAPLHSLALPLEYDRWAAMLFLVEGIYVASHHLFFLLACILTCIYIYTDTSPLWARACRLTPLPLPPPPLLLDAPGRGCLPGGRTGPVC
jgi:hypothetical protein